jgi:hypothetical protein
MNLIEELTLLRRAERVMGRIGDGLLGSDRDVLEAVVDAYADTILLVLESEMPPGTLKAEPVTAKTHDDLTVAYMAGFERGRDSVLPPVDRQVTQTVEDPEPTVDKPDDPAAEVSA